MANLTRYSPFASLQEEVDRLFTDFLPRRFESETGPAQTLWTPRMDLTEKEDAYVAKLDLPGLKKEDIDIHFEDGRLTISGKREAEKKEEKENYVRMERTYGSFYRAFTLPRETKPDHIDAKFTDGVLTIRIPKTEKSKPKQIKVG